MRNEVSMKQVFEKINKWLKPKSRHVLSDLNRLYQKSMPNIHIPILFYFRLSAYYMNSMTLSSYVNYTC